VSSAKPAAAISEANRMFDLLKVKQLEIVPEDVAGAVTSPSLSPSPSNNSLNFAESVAAMTLSAAQASNSVALCAESSGICGLFPRAQAIGQQGQSTATGGSVRRIIGGPATVAASVPSANEGGGNPLARRGSAVMKQQQPQAESSPRVAGAGASEGSSLMEEVPDELLSAYNIRPSEDVTPPPAPAPAAGRADPFATRRLSPLKPSEKSQSLMADLMGAPAPSAARATSPKPSSSVWEDV
jgi:hypothetical protein